MQALLLPFLLCAGGSHVDAQVRVDSLVPILPMGDALPGLAVSDSARRYEGEELYHFIDGGADIFLEYGFRHAEAMEYEGAGTFNLEVYEMSDPGAAFGIFSVRAGGEGEAVALGDGGLARSSYIMFWKGRYYVSISASDTTPESRRILMSLAHAVDKRISGHGVPPMILKLLPAENCITRKYFRGFLGLSAFEPIGASDIFHAQEGVAGVYSGHTLLIFRYDGRESAAKRFAELDSALHADAHDSVHRTRDGILWKIDGRHRVLCFARAGANIVTSISPDQADALNECSSLRGMMGSD